MDVRSPTTAPTRTVSALPCVTHNHVTKMPERNTAMLGRMKMDVGLELTVPSFVEYKENKKSQKLDFFMVVIS